MNHNLPPSIVEMLKERKLATSEAHYFVLPHLDMSPYDETVDGVSVIMIVYHTGKVLFEAIEKVLDEQQVRQFIIIDNGSSEKAAQKLRDLNDEYDHILLVQGHGNIGFAKAANLGAHLANQPWLVFLNPDALLQQGCIKRLVESARGQPSPCIVGSRLLNPDGSEQRGARRGEVTPVTTLLALTRLSKLVPDLQKFEIHYEDNELPDAPLPVPTISGACFAVSKRDFARLKGFDSHFFLHVEDVDLCWRAREAGGLVLFHPKAEVMHIGHTSRVEPLHVEWNKGMGLCYYFHKRAKGFWRKTYVTLLTPVILAVSVARAVVRPRLRNDEDEIAAG
ncbi:glycosyltransferase [Asticcacaulis sp. AC402]|uniref:glycosyltransferase n=1 Tax=Asticcacaulis sp. AC402 TaxID=1282361 RepID=UPI0003C3F86B|nr:glycosyltransferase family 2 protein [Asticcacaulis sp. AC402]ESQ74384.1 glycosyl transferase [Asticcacaulis sp. AC402]